jgi:uncharacterized protein
MTPVESISLGTFLVVVIGVAVLEARLLAGWAHARIRGKDSKAFRGWNRLVHILSIIGLLCVLYGYFIEPYWIEITHHRLYTKKAKGAGLRIVQITDLHCDIKQRNEGKLADLVNPLQPDVIVFTGDAVNEYEALENFALAIRNLRAGMGKFAVMGNWDATGGPAEDILREAGFTILERPAEKTMAEVVKDGARYRFFGSTFGDPDPALKQLGEAQDSTCNILLYHTPDLVEEEAVRQADLYLAGHTHGGQIALPFYGALVTLSRYGKKYESGRYRVGGTVLYVCRGIGMEGRSAPRVRFWARPEIAVFDIAPEGQRAD